MKISYPCNIKKDEDGRYFVKFTDFQEAFTEGETLEEALFNAAEVLSLVIEQRLEDNVELPKPTKGKYHIEPNAVVQAAALIHTARGKKSLSELARTLGTSWAAVQRLEDPKHSPTLKNLEKAASAMGKKLVLSFE